MKLKDNVIRWQEEVKKLAEQNDKLVKVSEDLNGDIMLVKEQITKLVDITKEMTDTLLMLINQQNNCF